LDFSGSGATGGSQSMIVLDNIKMYEVDMIPFFKYFNDSNIYKGIQVPYVGLAPNIDYLNSDFIFIDNITIGLDSINNTIKEGNTNICVPDVIVINTDKVIVVTDQLVTLITETSSTCSGSITIQGNITVSQVGIVYSTSPLPLNLGSDNSEIGVGNSFSVNLTGLINNTTYYYAAYATVGIITTYGTTYTFITVKTPPDYSSDYSPTDYSTI